MQLLDGLSSAQFLAEYWQKKPLLIRQAIPNFKGLLSPDELAGLACEEDVQARLVTYLKNQWQVRHGPFSEEDFAKLPNGKNKKYDWTLLVQNVNHYLPEAADLLALFNFIPHARLDDLMVSYAPKGGGIGAHVDSYDVFLLQGLGERRWKITAQANLELIENAPLKILKHFDSEQEWVLQPGDMLYLPPQVAHWGIAESDDCMTYSIGFRAPAAQELAQEFLSYMQDYICLPGLYGDPSLPLQQHPAKISASMLNQVDKMLKQITWDKSLVADFLGKYLTEPKSHVVFVPNKKIGVAKFVEALKTRALKLNLKSQMLFHKNRFYLNGELLDIQTPALQANIYKDLRALADTRTLDLRKTDISTIAALADLLYPAYLAGYLELA